MLDKATTDWHESAGSLRIESRAFIDGQYVDALSGETRPTMNPANGELLANVANCGPEDADRAAAIARRVFEAGTWSGMAPRRSQDGARSLGRVNGGACGTR